MTNRVKSWMLRSCAIALALMLTACQVAVSGSSSLATGASAKKARTYYHLGDSRVYEFKLKNRTPCVLAEDRDGSSSTVAITCDWGHVGVASR